MEAGKTSTMKIMYGASRPTSGNAWIFGRSIRSQMHAIRSTLGVCPQFDVLYPDLSALEHIELFCGIKGIPVWAMQKVAEQRLNHMKLWSVRNQRCVF
jgi:ABC-type multidrug transport system ATPase subunit